MVFDVFQYNLDKIFGEFGNWLICFDKSNMVAIMRSRDTGLTSSF